MEIRQIDSKATLPLRQEVLKPFLPIEECANPGDINPDTFHLGLFDANELVCVGSFEPEAHPDFMEAKKSFRLRGMATSPHHQGKGYGQLLLLKAFNLLQKKQVDFFWCNARIKAFGFYEQLGLKHHGELFEISKIGEHRMMYKWLDQDQINPS